MNLLSVLFPPKKPKGDALTPRGTRPPVVPAEYLKAFPHNDLHKIKTSRL